MKKIYLIFIFFSIIVCQLYAQTPVVFKELKLDPKLCWQINDFALLRSGSDLKQIPLKYNASCESVEVGRIDFEKKDLIICNQYIRNGKEAITTTKIEILRNDKAKKVDVFMATFGSSKMQRAGRIFENRKYLLVPKIPKDYKLDVHYSVNVVKP